MGFDAYPVFEVAARVVLICRKPFEGCFGPLASIVAAIGDHEIRRVIGECFFLFCAPIFAALLKGVLEGNEVIDVDARSLGVNLGNVIVVPFAFENDASFCVHLYRFPRANLKDLSARVEAVSIGVDPVLPLFAVVARGCLRGDRRF